MIIGLNTLETCVVGAGHGISLAINSVSVVASFLSTKESVHQTLGLKRSARDKVFHRIGVGIDFLGGVARLFDWLITKKAFVLAVIHFVALKTIGHITGVFSYFKKALDSAGALLELDEITSKFEIRNFSTLHKKDSLEVRKFSEWSNLFSNIIFVVTSGVELAALITGAVILSSLALQLLYAAGFVSLVASALFKLSSERVTLMIEDHRGNHDKKYSYKY